jgi:hypothetical protein
MIYTDEYDIYARLEKWGFGHETVRHGKGEYARDDDAEMQTAFARFMSTPWKAAGLCCDPGFAHIGASHRKSCQAIWASSSSSITSAKGAKCSSARW